MPGCPGSLDPQVLLEPFEEEFDLPMGIAVLGDGAVSCLRADQFNGLIVSQPFRFPDTPGLAIHGGVRTSPHVIR